MTTETDERWLPDGFPPPSFVVEPPPVVPEAPARDRRLVAGAVAGAVLALVGLIALTRGGGGDQTALDTAPATTTSLTPATFPPLPYVEPVPSPQTAPPTLPADPQTTIFPLVTTSSTPGTTTKAAAPGTTQRQSTPTQPSTAPTQPTQPTQPPPTSTTTTLPPPPVVRRLDISPQPGVSSPCEGALVTATVDGTNVTRVVLGVRRSGDDVGLDMSQVGPGTWRAALSMSEPGRVDLAVQATDGPGRDSPTVTTSFTCEPPPPPPPEP